MLITRNKIKLDGIWQFAMSQYSNDIKFCEEVILPGTMDENKKGNVNTEISSWYLNREYLYTGGAVYQKNVFIPADWQNKYISISFERTKKTKLWINNCYIGENKSYTTTHIYDISRYIKPGDDNIITVEVDNSSVDMPMSMYFNLGQDTSWVHQLTEHTQTNWNGILGNIEINCHDVMHIEHVAVRPNLQIMKAKLFITISRLSAVNEAVGNINISAQSFNSDQVPHITEVQSTPFRLDVGELQTVIKYDYSMTNAKLWDEYAPNLYMLECKMTAKSGSEEFESFYETTFGMRSFTADETSKQFSVNGRTTFLRGENNCAVFPLTAYAPTDVQSWIKVMKVYREYGLNHVRFHTWIPPRAAFEAADIVGMYIYCELPQWNYYSLTVQKDIDYFLNDTKRIFKDFLNFASFTMFGLGNELGLYLGFNKQLDDFIIECKKFETGVLYTDQGGWCDASEQDSFCVGPAAGNFPYGKIITQGNDFSYEYFTGLTKVPLIAHEIGQYQIYPNYKLELPKYIGVLKPANLEVWKKNLDKFNMADMASEFCYASGKLSAMLYRYEMEALIRTPKLAGFELLGLQDFSGQGTALVGILDAFLESKGVITPEEFKHTCNDVTILATMPTFVWKNSDKFTANINVSNYGLSDILGKINWSLVLNDGTTFAAGSIENCVIKQGVIATVGNVSISLADIKNPTKMTFKLCFDGTDIKNTYDNWLLQDNLEFAITDDILLSRCFDENAKQRLKDGGKVLIISYGTKEALPNSKAVGFKNDFWSPLFHNQNDDGHTVGLLIKERHQALFHFPTDCYTGFQWMEILKGARGIILDEALNIKSIVQPIGAIDEAHIFGAVFEAKVSNGKLLICSFNLIENENVVCKQLLYSLLEYMKSDDFKPDKELTYEFLGNILPNIPKPDTNIYEQECRDTMTQSKVLADRKPLEDLMVSTFKIIQSEYTAETFNPFYAAKLKAGGIMMDTYASQQKIDDMCKILHENIECLQKVD